MAFGGASFDTADTSERLRAAAEGSLDGGDEPIIVDPMQIPHYGPPTHCMQMIRYAEEDGLRMLWVTATNPAGSLSEQLRAHRDPDVVVVTVARDAQYRFRVGRRDGDRSVQLPARNLGDKRTGSPSSLSVPATCQIDATGYHRRRE